VGSNPTPAALEEYPDSKQVGASGSLRARTVVVTVPASKLGVESKGFVFTSGAESTNGRPDIRDRLPDDNRPFGQFKNPDAKTSLFPAQ